MRRGAVRKFDNNFAPKFVVRGLQLIWRGMRQAKASLEVLLKALNCRQHMQAISTKQFLDGNIIYDLALELVSCSFYTTTLSLNLVTNSKRSDATLPPIACQCKLQTAWSINNPQKGIVTGYIISISCKACSSSS